MTRKDSDLLTQVRLVLATTEPEGGRLPDRWYVHRLREVLGPPEHVWVPVSECGELADGEYLVQGTADGQAGCEGERRYAGGKWPGTIMRVTHILSPHLGPIPERPK